MAQIGETGEEREALARRLARRREARRRLAETGFELRLERLRLLIQEAVVQARENGAFRVGQALACASGVLIDIARPDADPACFRRAYARLSNFLRAADALARRTGARRLIPAVRAGLSAAFSFGWWWRVGVERSSPESALLWLCGSRHSFA